MESRLTEVETLVNQRNLLVNKTDHFADIKMEERQSANVEKIKGSVRRCEHLDEHLDVKRILPSPIYGLLIKKTKYTGILLGVFLQPRVSKVTLK